MRAVDVAYRPADPSDLDALHELSLGVQRERGHTPTFTIESIRRDWFDSATFNAATDSLIAVSGGEPVGYVGFEVQHGQVHGDGWVRPDSRGRGIGSALVRWVIDTARRREGVDGIWMHTAAEVEGAERLYERHGFVLDRSWLSMVNERPDDIGTPRWPEGLTARTFDDEDEACRWASEAWNTTFVDHWNFSRRDPEEYAERLRDPEEDLALWVFAFEGETLAGFCLTSVRKGENLVRGHLGPIGTAPTHRGIGLGRALVRHGVRLLADRGADEVRLGVDSENGSGAVQLYLSEGFRRDLESRSFRLEV